MADTPYMQLWPTDYLADTRHLTAEQHGAYMLLIMEAWLRPTCSLPDDDALLSRLCCMTPAQWKKNKPTVMAFWCLNKRRKEWVQPSAKHSGQRKIRRKQLPESIRANVFERDGQKCRYCGDTNGPFEIDHVLAVVRGGGNSVSNLVVACRECNRSKGSKILDTKAHQL